MTATLWNAGEALGRQGVQLVTAVILARILTPAEFGTVALLALVLGLAAVLTDAGFSTALIQRRAITAAHESSAFWVVLALGAAATALLVGVAPILASFYAEPQVAPLLRVMAFTVVATAAGSVPLALMMRRLQFRRLFVANLVAIVTSAVVAVTGALQGWGVWALAAQSLTLAVGSTLLYWTSAGWWPAARPTLAATRELAGFGGFMLAASLLNEAYLRAYTVLIGRWYGTQQLGYYARADSTQQIPGAALGSVVGRVGLPFFSSIAHDLPALHRGVRAALRGLMLINVPMMLGLAALAEPAVAALFGDQWGPAVPILQVLCLAGCLWPVHVVNMTALLAQGHARLLFRLEAIKKSAGLAFLIAGSFAGVLGVAWASVAFAVFASVVNVYYTEKFIGYGLAGQARDVAPIGLVSVVMAGIVWAAGVAWQPAPWLELLALAGSGAGLFFALATALRLEALRDAWRLVRGQRLTAAEPADEVSEPR